MSHKDLQEQGLKGGPGSVRANPANLFIVGHDGQGSTEQERINWLRAIFPKLADRFKAEDNDPRSNLPISEDEIRVFRPAHAKPVVYESMGVKFPDGCGHWSGKALLVVTTGRQTTKLARILNERRAAGGSPPIEIVASAKRFSTTLDRIEANVIENRQIITTTPTQRAWGAHRLIENGTPREEAMLLVGVKSEQGLKNLLGLLECSPTVQHAVDLGVDDGGVTMTSALEIARLKDHDKQDAELASRLGAAEGKTGREKKQALRGEQSGPKPVKPSHAKKIADTLAAGGHQENITIDGVVATIRYLSTGEPAAYDALPSSVLSAVIQAGKREEKPAKQQKAKGDGESAPEANDNSQRDAA